MSQLRPGVGLRNPAALSSTERVFHVSFAVDTRTSPVLFAEDPTPSGESRWTRAFHSAYIPPVLLLPSDDVSVLALCHLHRHTQGLLTLTPEDIKARINGNRSVSPSSLEKPRDESQMDEVMPALNSKFSLSSLLFPVLFLLLVMRTGTGPSSTGDNDFLPVLHPSSTSALPSKTYRLFFLCRPNQPHLVP